MSRRARRRAREGSGQYRRQAVPAARSARPSLDATRKALAVQMACAAVLALVALVGTVAIGGTLGPLLILALVALGAITVRLRTQAQLGGAVLADDDRLMMLFGSGLLVLAVAFAVIAAVVLAVA